MQITLDEIFDNDIKSFKTINHLVKQASQAGVELKSPSGEIYKNFDCTMIDPGDRDLGETLDTRPETILDRRQLGWDRAKEVIDGVAVLPPDAS